jgi:hypothetical protein
LIRFVVYLVDGSAFGTPLDTSTSEKFNIVKQQSIMGGRFSSSAATPFERKLFTLSLLTLLKSFLFHQASSNILGSANAALESGKNFEI